MNYSLNIGEWNSVFAVPTSVVDSYIKLAGGNSLKLLLFLLRHGGESFSAEQLKNELGFVEVGELEDAAYFWVQRGIISYNKDENGLLSPKAESRDEVSANDTAAPEARSDSGSAEQRSLDDIERETPPQPAKIIKVTPAAVSSGEIAQRIREDKKIEFLFSKAEELYGKPLKQRENQTIIALVDHYGLTAEVAVMLLKYCFGAGKTSPSYITAVAQEWSDNSVNSVELADARIHSLERQSELEKNICDSVGLKSALTKNQREFVKLWSEDWRFSEEMIILAINKTIDQIGEWKVKYTNKILENWKADNITTPQAAENETKPSDAQTASSFDVNDIMAQIMKNNYS